MHSSLISIELLFVDEDDDDDDVVVIVLFPIVVDDDDDTVAVVLFTKFFDDVRISFDVQCEFNKELLFDNDDALVPFPPPPEFDAVVVFVDDANPPMLITSLSLQLPVDKRCRNSSYLSSIVNFCNKFCNIVETSLRKLQSILIHVRVIERTCCIKRSSRKSYGNVSIHSANNCTKCPANVCNFCDVSKSVIIAVVAGVVVVAAAVVAVAVVVGVVVVTKLWFIVVDLGW